MFMNSLSSGRTFLRLLAYGSIILGLAWHGSTEARAQQSDQDRGIHSRILGGAPTDGFPSVGIVGSTSRGGFCSGTLIASQHVLTAAHCALEIPQETSGTFEIDGDIYRSAQIVIHPDFNRFTLDNDLAILVLAEAVTDVQPSTIFRGLPLVGDVLTIVGFGGSGTPADGSDNTFGIKRSGITTIDEVRPDLIIWKFDDVAESNTVAGDSGGPGFLNIDGQLLLAAVTSGGTESDSSLGDCAFNTRVDAYAGWIDTVVSGTQDPVDDSSDDDSDGDSGEDSTASDEMHDEIREILNGPFPLLRLLIYFLMALYDALVGEDDDGDTSEPMTDPAIDPMDDPAVPAGDNPAGDNPAGDQPLPPSSSVDGSADDGTGDLQPAGDLPFVGDAPVESRIRENSSPGRTRRGWGSWTRSRYWRDRQ